MTLKDPRPGAHNHVAGAPDESFRYVADPDADPAAVQAIARYDATKRELVRSVREYNCMTGAGKFLIEIEVRHFNPRASLDSMLRTLPKAAAGSSRYGVVSWRYVDE